MVYNTLLLLNYLSQGSIVTPTVKDYIDWKLTEVQCRLIDGVSLNIFLSVVLAELKLLNPGARAIVSASLSS